MMSFEVLCSRCQGRLLVETAGVVVACPYCDLHLSVPASAPAEPAAAGTGDGNPPVNASAEAIAVPVEAADDATATIQLDSSGKPCSDPNPIRGNLETEMETVRDLSREEVFSAADARPQAAGTVDAKPVANTPAASELTPGGGPRPSVPRSLFIAVLSYASAVTIACAVLLLRGPDPHQLESLPDIKPPMKQNKIGFELIDEAESMAPGHTLRLNETQRFGSLNVTPLRVSRGPIQFVHYDGDAEKTREPTQPVLKLWIRFENVSNDQVFAPLDQTLLLKSTQDKNDFGLFRANNFICRLTEKSSREQKVLVYNNSPIIPVSEWDLRDQQLGRELSPGETLDTYIASAEEGVDRLTGQLIWRLHFRKGYNCDSLRGVTTLIEVSFNSEDIQQESSAVRG